MPYIICAWTKCQHNQDEQCLNCNEEVILIKNEKYDYFKCNNFKIKNE